MQKSLSHGKKLPQLHSLPSSIFFWPQTAFTWNFMPLFSYFNEYFCHIGSVFCDRPPHGIAGIWTPICRWIIAAENAGHSLCHWCYGRAFLAAAKPYRGQVRDIETWDGRGADTFGELGARNSLTRLNWKKPKQQHLRFFLCGRQESSSNASLFEIYFLRATGKSTNASFFLFFPAPPPLSLAILLFSQFAAFPAFNSYKCRQNDFILRGSAIWPDGYFSILSCVENWDWLDECLLEKVSDKTLWRSIASK